MMNEDLRGKLFQWRKVKTWPLTQVLEDNGKEVMRLESKALLGMVFWVTYENRRFELRRKQLPPFDILIKELSTEEDIGVAKYVFAFRRPFLIEFDNRKKMELIPMSPTDPHANSVFKDATWDIGCIIADEAGRLMAGTIFHRGLIHVTKTFYVFEMNQDDPDAFLLAAISWLAVYASLQERGG